MQYRCDRIGTKLSILGYGCLRFPKAGGKIDVNAVTEQIGEAVRLGVNYFDTAYVYGGSEAALGEALRRLGCRDKIYIADKLPQYLIKSKAGIERCFNEQLSRLGTDHIDFYLMHMLTDLAAWNKLCALGVQKWIEEKKAAGAIGHIGFSFHGDTAAFLELLNAYDWDFCQIQYNYLDENTQAGRRGLEAAAAKGIPVVIMEPLRGGRLVTGLSAEMQKRVEESGRSAAGWGLRWLWNQPGVTVVLSGMNSLEMIRDNAAQAAQAQPGCMTQAECDFVEMLRTDLQTSMRVGCTGCGYCQPCPAGVDIPGIFASYNRAAAEGGHAKIQYLLTTGLRRKATGASQCLGCGKCEQHCPQNLPIRNLLKDAAKELEGPLYKAARLGVKILKLW